MKPKLEWSKYKAISPLLGVVILLAITVSLGYIAGSIFAKIIQKQTSSQEIQTLSSCSAAALQITNSFLTLNITYQSWFNTSWQYRREITIQGHSWSESNSNTTSLTLNTTAGITEVTHKIWVGKYLSGPIPANLTLTYVNTTQSAVGTKFNISINGHLLGTLTVPSTQTTYTFTNVSVSWLTPNSYNEITYSTNNPLDSLDIKYSLLTYNISAIENYQVLLQLNLTREYLNNKIQPFCNDTLFTYWNTTTRKEQEIPYWIEQCNLTDPTQLAKIWIKLPLIRASSQEKVYFYYGNPNAKSKSNGTLVFEFFDDFEDGDISDWTYDSAWSVSSEVAYGSYSLKKYDASGTTEYNANKNFTLQKEFVFTGYIYVVSTNGGQNSIALLNENGVEIGRLWFSIWGNQNIGYTDNTGNIDTGVGYSLNTWYRYKMVFRTTGWNFYVYNPDGSILTYLENIRLINPWTSISGLNLRSGLGETGIAYHDNLRARKYTSPEPSSTISQQEQQYIPSIYTLSLILRNPSSSTDLQGVRAALIYPDNTKELREFPQETIPKGGIEVITINNLPEKPRKVIISAMNCPVYAEKEIG